jgi:hypothetical protein
MSTAGVATPQILNYSEVVDVNLAADNDVNFADVEDYGHRVQVELNVEAANNYLGWERLVGADRPKAKLVSANETAFKTAIETALSISFVDIDGVSGGLHFGTTNFDINTDTRKRTSGVTCSANDLPLCFILYKLYGSSTTQTLNNIYNLEDAHGMLSNSVVSTAIVDSFKAAEAGAVDTMFRDLLAADPHRFFNSSGIPDAGIFETNADAPGSGTWKMTVGDIIEVKLKLIFNSRVTRRGVASREHNLTVNDADALQENQQTIIAPEDFFYVRLQLKISDSSAPIVLAGGSIVFNYTLDSYLNFFNYNDIQASNPNAFTIFDNSFTIEWYQYWEAGTTTPFVFSIGQDNYYDIAVSYHDTGFTFWKNWDTINIGPNPPQNVWTHIAIVGTSGVGIKIYQDGTQIGNLVGEYNFPDDTSPMFIGRGTSAEGNTFFTGKITNFRYVLGTAVYTTNFTKPSIPLANITGTKFLLLAENEANVTTDSSGLSRTINIDYYHGGDISYSSDRPS